MATMKEVAEEAGVSITTVSHVVNGTRYVSPETTSKVEEAMDELGYRPNVVAQGLATKKTNSIGLLLSDISNPFFSTLTRGVEDYASEKNYSLVVCNTEEDPLQEKLYVELLTQRMIDGMLLTLNSPKANQKLREVQVPFVLIDRLVSGLSGDAVLADNVKGAMRAINYLINKGHHRIGIIVGPKETTPGEERLEGYRNALYENDISVEDKLIQQAEFTISGGAEACKNLLELEDPPTAVFSTNNTITIGAMEVIKEKGLKCPEGVSMMAFDDFDWMRISDPPLTTISHDPYEMGYKAAEMLFRKIENGASESTTNSQKIVRTDVELVKRESVCPISATA